MALQAYYQDYGSFPPAYIPDARGNPMHSWRVLIMPYLERGDIYKTYRFDEPWNGPNNSKLQVHIEMLRCPSDKAPLGPSTNYLAVVGPNTAWPGKTGSTLADFTDGPNETIQIVEVANSGINWFEPRDLYLNQMARTINPKQGQGISGKHEGRANVAMADGSVRSLQETITQEQLDALVTRNGGETVDRSNW